MINNNNKTMQLNIKQTIALENTHTKFVNFNIILHPIIREYPIRQAVCQGYYASFTLDQEQISIVSLNFAH